MIILNDLFQKKIIALPVALLRFPSKKNLLSNMIILAYKYVIRDLVDWTISIFAYRDIIVRIGSNFVTFTKVILKISILLIT